MKISYARFLSEYPITIIGSTIGGLAAYVCIDSAQDGYILYSSIMGSIAGISLITSFVGSVIERNEHK